MIERLKVIIAHFGYSERAFALKCGLKQATLDKQLKGLRAVSLDTIQAILSTFGDVSAEWLMRGNGSMFEESNEISADYEKMARLVDTITMLQSALNEKNKTIQALEQEVLKLKK